MKGGQLTSMVLENVLDWAKRNRSKMAATQRKLRSHWDFLRPGIDPE